MITPQVELASLQPLKSRFSTHPTAGHPPNSLEGPMQHPKEWRSMPATSLFRSCRVFLFPIVLHGMRLHYVTQKRNINKSASASSAPCQPRALTLQLCQATQCCSSLVAAYISKLYRKVIVFWMLFSSIVLHFLWLWQAFQKGASWLWSGRDTWFTPISCNTFRTKVMPCHACRNAAQNNAKLKMGLGG